MLAEELLEVNVAGMQTLQSINDNNMEGELIIELAQTAAVCVRAIEMLINQASEKGGENND